jgi:hypothetical protein
MITNRLLNRTYRFAWQICLFRRWETTLFSPLLWTVQHFPGDTNANIKMQIISLSWDQLSGHEHYVFQFVMQVTWVGALQQETRPYWAHICCSYWRRIRYDSCANGHCLVRLVCAFPLALFCVPLHHTNCQIAFPHYAVSVGGILTAPLLFISPLSSGLTLTRVRRHVPISCSRYSRRFYVTPHREDWTSCTQCPPPIGVLSPAKERLSFACRPGRQLVTRLITVPKRPNQRLECEGLVTSRETTGTHTHVWTQVTQRGVKSASCSQWCRSIGANLLSVVQAMGVTPNAFAIGPRRVYRIASRSLTIGNCFVICDAHLRCYWRQICTSLITFSAVRIMRSTQPREYWKKK